MTDACVRCVSIAGDSTSRTRSFIVCAIICIVIAVLSLLRRVHCNAIAVGKSQQIYTHFRIVNPHRSHLL